MTNLNPRFRYFGLCALLFIFGCAKTPPPIAEAEAKLTNRPIPKIYGSVNTTPLKVEVTKDQKSYELKLNR